VRGGQSHIRVHRGVTLVEVLVVMGLIAVLLSFILTGAVYLYRAVYNLSGPHKPRQAVYPAQIFVRDRVD
jgi:prepilin-type N-terminal cleavage/methylation domain-containing protein